MAGQLAGGLNTIVPLLEASGNLLVKFARNPKSCKLNQYTVQIAAPVPRGTYLYFNPSDSVRVRTHLKWAFGTPAPTGFDNQVGFEQKNFACIRYAPTTTLDKFGTDIASFDVQKVHTEKLALEAMINRTSVVLAAVTNTANYPAANVVTATSLAGGFLDGGTTADPRIYKALTGAAYLIQKATAGRAGIAGAKFGVLMSPDTARRLALSREIREYVMQNDGALGRVTGDDEAFMDSSSYMLPPKLYKFETVVEDTFINTGNPDSALDLNLPVMPDNTLIVYVKTGGFNKEYGEADFSSFTQFVHEDMNAESMTSEWDRLITLRVVDNFDFKITSPVSVVVITNCFS